MTPFALTAAINTEKPELAARYLAAGSGASVSALLAACYGGYADLVSAILKKGVDADSVGPSGLTPLEAAVLSGSIEIVRTLLEHGATVGKKDGRGRTVLEFLEQSGGDADNDIKTLLEETGKDPGAFSLRSDLTRAVLKKDTAAVQKLLARKPDPGTLIVAEDEPSVRLLNNAPMLIDVACVLESREIVRLLVQNGAAVGYWSPGLRWAAGVGRADLVDLLLSASEWEEGDSQGRLDMALLEAAENGNADLTAMLLAKGADANSPARPDRAHERRGKRLSRGGQGAAGEGGQGQYALQLENPGYLGALARHGRGSTGHREAPPVQRGGRERVHGRRHDSPDLDRSGPVTATPSCSC